MAGNHKAQMEDFVFLNERIVKMQSLMNEQELYDFVAESIFELLEGRVIVTIADLDPKRQKWKLRLVKGIGDKRKKLRSILGFEISNLRGEVHPKYKELLTSSKMVKLDLNFPELLNDKISSASGLLVKKLFSIKDIYCAAIQHKDNHYANISIIEKSSCKDLNIPLIESMISVLSVFIDKIYAENKLKKSEERLTLALKSGRQGMFDLNVKTGKAIVNIEYVSMLGYDPSGFEETNNKWIERLHPEDKDRVSKEYQDYIDGKIDKYAVEFRQRTANDEWKWILSQGEIVQYDLDGKPVRMLGTHTDLTDIKKVEYELRESKEQLQALFDNMSSGFAYHKIITDKKDNVVDYVFLNVNKAFEKLIGLKARDVIGKRVTRVLPGTENDPANWIEVYGKVAQSGKSRSFEEFSNSVGRWFHIDVYSPQKGYFATTFEDITERIEAQKILRQKAEIINSTTDGIISTDLEGRILSWNEGAEKIYGYQANEAFGKSVSMLYQKDDLIKLDGLIEQLLQGEKIENIELSLIHKSGKKIPILLSLTSLKDGKGVVNELVGFSREITLLNQMQNELQKRNEFVQTILDRLPIGIALNKFDEGTATYINKKFEEIYGWPKEELENIEKFFLKVYPDKSYREPLMKKVIADIESEDPDRMHWEGILPTTKNGERKIVNAVNIPLIEQNTMVSTVMDVTDLKRTENELQQHKEKLEELIRERTAELEQANKDLQEKNKELAHFNELFIGREFRINELKEKLAALENKNQGKSSS